MLSTAMIGSHSAAEILNGDCQIVFTSPEMLLKEYWRSMLKSDVYSKRLRAFVIDEVHTCKSWYVIISSLHMHFKC